MLFDGVEVFAGTGVSLTVTLTSDGTYSISTTGDTDHMFCDATTSCTESGTYTHTSTALTFCDPGCDEAGSYTVSGNTMTYTSVEVEDGEIITMTITFVRI